MTTTAATDAKIAAELQLPVEAVRRHRIAFAEDKILRALFTERLSGQIEERRKQLETVTPDDLKAKQGEIAGLRTALAMVLKGD